MGKGRQLKITPNEGWLLLQSIHENLVRRASDSPHPNSLQVSRNGIQFKVALTEHLDFWDLFRKGQWESETLEIADRFRLRRDARFSWAKYWRQIHDLIQPQAARTDSKYRPSISIGRIGVYLPLRGRLGIIPWRLPA